jgi:hypothetical protein
MCALRRPARGRGFEVRGMRRHHQHLLRRAIERIAGRAVNLDRRCVGQQGHARALGDAQQLQAPGLHQRQCCQHAVEHELGVAGGDVADRLRAAAERHVHELHAGGQRDLDCAEVICRADARRGDVDRLFLRQLGQFLDVAGRDRRVRAQQVRRVGEHGRAGQLCGFVGQGLVHHRVDR